MLGMMEKSTIMAKKPIARRNSLGLKDVIHPRDSLQWGNATVKLVLEKGGIEELKYLSGNGVPLNWVEINKAIKDKENGKLQ